VRNKFDGKKKECGAFSSFQRQSQEADKGKNQVPAKKRRTDKKTQNGNNP